MAPEKRASSVGADVSALLIGWDAVSLDDGDLTGVPARDVEFGDHPGVDRQQDLLAGGCGLLGVTGAGFDLLSVQQRAADLVAALRLQEGVGHAAADDQGVGDLQQVVDHGQFVGDLGATRKLRRRKGWRRLQSAS